MPDPAEPDPTDDLVRADDATPTDPGPEPGAGSVPDPGELPAADPADRAPAPARRWGLIIGVAAAVYALDQLSKWWAVRTLSSRTIHVVWTLQFKLTGNTGASFSRFGGQGPLISLAAVAVVAAVLWMSPGVSSRLGSIAMGMILGGALGNLTDRVVRGDAGLLHGAVVDFIDFQWWPVFNVADMGVVIGALLLALSFLLTPTVPAPAPASGSGPVGSGPTDG